MQGCPQKWPEKTDIVFYEEGSWFSPPFVHKGAFHIRQVLIETMGCKYFFCYSTYSKFDKCF